MSTAGDWINKLGLEPHPEGGWFRRVYTSDRRLEGNRPVMTSIYYLLEAPDFSALHRLNADEQWHFYAGSPITIHELTADGLLETTLGEHAFQHTVKSGTLFGATVEHGWALVGCTVVPGFDFSGFEMPSRDQLMDQFPNQYDFIVRLSR